MPSQQEHQQIAEDMTPLAVERVDSAWEAYETGDQPQAAFHLSAALVFASVANAHAMLATIPDPVTVPGMTS